jgi:ATPase family AAA domain-containing protein 3A/B
MFCTLQQFEAAQQQSKNESIEREGAEKRKTLAEETKQHARRADYQDQLARKRNDEMLAKQVSAPSMLYQNGRM